MKIHSDYLGVLGSGSRSVPFKNEIGNPSISLSQRLVIRVRSEEKLLRAAFGKEFEDYAERVPAALPGIF